MSPPACRLGLLLAPSTSGSVGDMPRLAAAAEAQGYDSVWVGEANAAAAFAIAGSAAAVTERVRIGTAIVPVYGRAPGVVAQEAATVQRLSGNRFVLGIGTSTRVIAELWRGETFDRPVTRLREYVHVIRELLAGRRVTFGGDAVRVDGFAIDLEPAETVPLYLGGFGPAVVRLAAQVADGLILSVPSVRGVADCADRLRAATRDGAVELASRIMVVLGDDGEAVLARSRRLLTFYLSAPPYRAWLGRQGFAAEVEVFARLWDRGDHKQATMTISPDFLDAVGVLTGPARAIGRRLDEYAAAGLTTAILHPVVVGDGAGASDRLAAFMAELASANREAIA